MTTKAITIDALSEIADRWTDTDYGSFMECVFAVFTEDGDRPGIVDVDDDPDKPSPYGDDVLTVRKLRAILAPIDGDTIVTVYDDAPHDWYRHVAAVEVPDAEEGVSVVVTMGRDFDTREV